MPPSGDPPASARPLHGRGDELETIHAVAAAARNGRGGALLIEGAPGVGKTSLLDAAVDAATSGAGPMRILRIAGFDVEAALPYAALQRLGSPLAAYGAALPPAQRAALRIAVGLGSGDPPQRALVGLGALSLLSRAGDDTPTMCIVDDAHHLDTESMQVLGFVARRLSAERVALVIATREDESVLRAFAGVLSLTLTGLDDESAMAVLREATTGELDPSIAAEIVAYTGGNPLALRELGAQWSVDALTDAAIAHEPVPIGRQLEEHYRARVTRLSDDAQRWLLAAAAESTGDASVVRAAAVGLGLDDGASADAEASGLVEIRDRVRFRHPLVRSALYGCASDADRRRVHRALQLETAARGWREVAVWHAAAAASGPDDAVAAELAAVADLAGARGGPISRSRLLARAAELSPSPEARGALLLGAAEAAIAAGAGLLARQLAERIALDELDPIGHGRLLIVRAMCALFLSDPAELPHGVATLVAAADAFRGLVPTLEQRALLMAVMFAQTTEDRSEGITLTGLGERLRAGASVCESPYAVALRAMSALILDDYDDAVPYLRDAVAMLDELNDDDLLEFSFYCVSPTIALWDADGASRLLHRTLRISRERGALREVDSVLWVLSAVELGRMNPRLAGDYLAQADELRRALGYGDQLAVNAAYLAWLGTPIAMVEQIAEASRASGFAGISRMASSAMASVELAAGDYASAFTRLEPLADAPFLQAGLTFAADFAEAAVHAGRHPAAVDAARRLDRYAAATGSAWARGVAHRVHGLLAGDEDAEQHFLDSIAALGTAGHRGDRGRSRLVYGEWLRRVRRRSDARDQLTAAAEDLEAVGADAFAQRARRELTATGGVAARQAVSPLGDLTPQESEVARLAARGATNAEIGAALFISANTVDYHLRKVFRKLDVTSRRQLSAYLSAG